MNRRIALGAMFALLFAFTAFVNAEEPKKEGKGKGGPPRGGGIFVLVEKLDGLTDDQKSQIAKIKADTEAALEAAKEAKDRDAARKAFESVREKLAAVLTDDQKAQLKKMLEEHRPKGDRPAGEKPKGDRPPKGDK